MKNNNVALIVVLSLLSFFVMADEGGSPVGNWLSDTKVRYPYEGSPIQWKFAHPAPPASLLPPIWQSGFDWLNKVTEQGMTIKQYGGGTLYGVKGGARAIRAGVADFGTCYSYYESSGFELTNAFKVPYLLPENIYLAAKIIAELAPTYVKPEFERRGVYLGHLFPVSPMALMSKTPIKKPADLKGKKVASFMRSSEAAEIIGYEEVQLPFPEIYTALQQGVIDAVIWSDMGFVPFKIYEQAGFYTDINIASGTIETCINKRSFNALPKGLKQAVYDTQQKLMMALVDKSVTFSQSAIPLYNKQGVEVIVLSPEEREEWKRAFEPIRKNWLKSCQDSGKECLKLVDDINRLEEKYGGLSNQALMQSIIDNPVPGIIDF